MRRSCSTSHVAPLTAYGTGTSDIADILGIGEDELVERYADELRKGPLEANAKVTEALYKKALSGDQRAMEVWLQTRGGLL